MSRFCLCKGLILAHPLPSILWHRKLSVKRLVGNLATIAPTAWHHSLVEVQGAHMGSLVEISFPWSNFAQTPLLSHPLKDLTLRAAVGKELSRRKSRAILDWAAWLSSCPRFHVRFLCRHLVQNLTRLDFAFLSLGLWCIKGEAHWGLSPLGNLAGLLLQWINDEEKPQAATISSLLPSFLSSETSALSPVSLNLEPVIPPYLVCRWCCTGIPRVSISCIFFPSL